MELLSILPPEIQALILDDLDIFELKAVLGHSPELVPLVNYYTCNMGQVERFMTVPGMVHHELDSDPIKSQPAPKGLINVYEFVLHRDVLGSLLARVKSTLNNFIHIHTTAGSYGKVENTTVVNSLLPMAKISLVGLDPVFPYQRSGQLTVNIVRPELSHRLTISNFDSCYISYDPAEDHYGNSAAVNVSSVRTLDLMNIPESALIEFNFHTAGTETLHLRTASPCPLKDCVVFTEADVIMGPFSSIENVSFKTAYITLEMMGSTNDMTTRISNVEMLHCSNLSLNLRRDNIEVVNVRTPVLETTSINCLDGPGEALRQGGPDYDEVNSDFSFLSYAKGIFLLGLNAPILQQRSFEQVKTISMVITHPLPTDLHMHTPELSSLQLVVNTTSFHIPNFKTDKLKAFILKVLDNDDIMEETNIPQYLNSSSALEVLQFEVFCRVGPNVLPLLYDSLRTRARHLKTLTVLGFNFDIIAALQTSPLVAPKLVQLQITSHGPEQEEPYEVRLDAPSLVDLHLCYPPSVSKFGIQGCPALETLTVASDVESLIINDDMFQLHKIEAYGYLGRVVAGKLPSLEKIIYEDGPGPDILLELVTEVHPFCEVVHQPVRHFWDTDEDDDDDDDDDDGPDDPLDELSDDDHDLVRMEDVEWL